MEALAQFLILTEEPEPSGLTTVLAERQAIAAPCKGKFFGETELQTENLGDFLLSFHPKILPAILVVSSK